jgi:hypothetical protein
MFNTYDPGKVAASFRGVPLIGIASGTFISAERTEDAYSMEVGSGGDVTRVQSRNRTGSVTFTLMAASPANDLLSGLARQDELFGVGFGPLLVKDLNGNTLLAAETAWIRKVPTVDFADEAGAREWVIDCAELRMHVGGQIV